jgi:hypothetical protein
VALMQAVKELQYKPFVPFIQFLRPFLGAMRFCRSWWFACFLLLVACAAER